MDGWVLGECGGRARLGRAMDCSFRQDPDGISRTVQDSQAVAYEFLQIRETEAGELEYIARPSGQEEASFLLARMSAGEVVFENASHDFPQRISYRLTAEGNLAARIEGEERGEVRTIDFSMRRIDCESQMPIR